MSFIQIFEMLTATQIIPSTTTMINVLGQQQDCVCLSKIMKIFLLKKSLVMNEGVHSSTLTSSSVNWNIFSFTFRTVKVFT